jgi:hypothetical protein
MHHYTKVTCEQLPNIEPALSKNSIWSIDIPRLAFESDLVLSALMGLSALHLSALNPNDRQLHFASSYYFGKAVRDNRTALTRVDERSAEPLLAAAILMTHYSWLAAHLVSPNESYELPLKTYYMARGIQRLFVQLAPNLGDSGLLWYAKKLPETEIEDARERKDFFNRCQDDLETISGTFLRSNVDINDKSVYEATVTELSSMYSAISQGGPPNVIQRRVATMPLILPSRFLELVEVKDPIALALLARNLAMLKLIDEAWWLHGVGQNEVAKQSVLGIQSLMPSEWQWAMEWPVNVVNESIRSDP